MDRFRNIQKVKEYGSADNAVPVTALPNTNDKPQFKPYAVVL